MNNNRNLKCLFQKWDFCLVVLNKPVGGIEEHILTAPVAN